MLDSSTPIRHCAHAWAALALALGMAMAGITQGASAGPAEPAERLREAQTGRRDAQTAQSVGGPSAKSGKSASAKPAQVREPALGGGPHWEYWGDNGPQAWGNLAPEFALCGTGRKQSPIDIQRVYTGSEPRIQFNYRPSRLRIVNNGHTIQVNYDPGSFIKIDDRAFELEQFHFHVPSEHTLKGQTFDMEVHLVHKSADGALAVVGVLMQRGAVNEGLQEVWEHLPGLAGEERSYQTVLVNAADLLPANPSYYLYRGSLTTPPCTEGVRWSLLVTPIEVSDAQVTTFKRLFPLNARPVQPLNERFVINVVVPKG